MYVLVLILHILVSFVLMAVVLMQSGKGRGLAGAFGGGGGNQTLFGGRGAVDFLGKATWVLGGAFMVTSLVLAVMAGGHSQRSTQDSLIQKASPTAPALPSGPMPGTEQEGLPAQTPADPGTQIPAGEAAPTTPPAGEAPGGNPPGGSPSGGN